MMRNGHELLSNRTLCFDTYVSNETMIYLIFFLFLLNKNRPISGIAELYKMDDAPTVRATTQC